MRTIGVCVWMLSALACTATDGGRFLIEGRLPRTRSAATPGSLQQAQTVTGAATVTHVMAVNPSSQASQRVLAPVEGDGNFSLEVDAARPWVLVFVDAHRIGKDMIVAVFKAEALDSLTPARDGGEADLGELSVEEGTASTGIGYGELLAALGIDEATAAYLGAIDDVCLRYVNPDIDGDGIIDVEEPDHGFMLDFHVQLQFGGEDGGASMRDLLDAYLPADVSPDYRGTGIMVSFPDAFYAGDLASTAWATFAQPLHRTVFAAGGPRDEITEAGAAVAGEDLAFVRFGDYSGFGIYASPGYDLPQGEYRFGVGTTTLTFTHVATRSDAELAAAENLIMPFIKINRADAGCVSGCTLASIDYEWRRRTGAGWVLAREEEVALVVNEAGGTISLVKGYDNGTQRLAWVIPTAPVTGRLSWGDAWTEDLTPAELAATTTEELCHLGLSYDDKLGMRMFAGIMNAPGTCPMR